MKKGLGKVFKVAILTIVVILIVIFLIIYIGALLEKPPGHSLDFQDINNIPIGKSIRSVEDGLPYSIKQAHEWREDAVLTGVEIISNGNEEVKNRNGMLIYKFQFGYVDKSKPNGMMYIFVNTNTNNIELVDVKHDEVRIEDYNELKANGLDKKIMKIYDVAIEAIGKDIVFQNEPFVSVSINSEFATFELSSAANPNAIKNRVKIDMETYDILSKE